MKIQDYTRKNGYSSSITHHFTVPVDFAKSAELHLVGVFTIPKPLTTKGAISSNRVERSIFKEWLGGGGLCIKRKLGYDRIVDLVIRW